MKQFIIFVLLIGSALATNNGWSPACSGCINSGNGGCVAGGTCYYIDFTSGLDTNNGTSKVTAWKHAPGMACATNNASSHSFAQTDEFILKGGETWPYACFQWTVNSGGAGTPNGYAYPGMYIGYDPTWNDGTVVHVIVSDPGVCTSNVVLTVNFSGGGGSSAAATANIEPSNAATATGDLSFVTMTNHGSGYTSNPTVSFTPTTGSCSNLPTAYADIYSPVMNGSAGTFGSGGTIPQMFYANIAYLTVDHIEFAHFHFSTTNNCPNNAPNMIDMFSTNDVLQNSFIHDFTGSPLSGLTGNCDDSQTSAVYMNGQPNGDTLNNNILNNWESEALGCNGNGQTVCVQSTAINNAQFNTNNVYNDWRGALYVVDNSSNYLTAGNKMWAALYDPGTQHGDTFYLHAGGLLYNNILRDVVGGTASFYLETGDGTTPTAVGNQIYVFNNVIWNIGTSTPPTGFTSEFWGAATNASPTPTLYSANNSYYSFGGNTDCINAGQWFGNSAARSLATPGFNFTLYNNYCISTQGTDHWFDSNGSASPCNSSPNGCGIWNGLTGPNSTTTQNAIDPLNVIQTPTTATSQGYTAANGYAPTLASNDTVTFATGGNSQNLTSLCSTSLNGLSLAPLCQDINGNTRPTSGGWQAGAYEYTAGSAPPTAPALSIFATQLTEGGLCVESYCLW